MEKLKLFIWVLRCMGIPKNVVGSEFSVALLLHTLNVFLNTELWVCLVGIESQRDFELKVVT